MTRSEASDLDGYIDGYTNRCLNPTLMSITNIATFKTNSAIAYKCCDNKLSAVQIHESFPMSKVFKRKNSN